MTTIEWKAMRLIADGHVTLKWSRADRTGRFVADGTVQGDHGTYTVKVEPGGNHCGCEYGTQIPGVTCSHVRALEAAAWLEATRTKESV
jgi:hypothetical protein